MALFDRPATCRTGKVMKVKTEATPQGQILHDLGKFGKASGSCKSSRGHDNHTRTWEYDGPCSALFYKMEWTASDSSCIVMFYDVFMMLFTCGFQMP
jgi:hypothetical protein